MLDYVTNCQDSRKIQNLAENSVEMQDILTAKDAKEKLISWINHYLKNVGVVTPEYS